jgi:hypothetical protein
MFAIQAARAETVSVHLVNAAGQCAIGSEVKDIFSRVQIKLNETGVRPKLSRYTEIQDDSTNLTGARDRYNYWRERALSLGWFRNVQVVHVAMGPLSIGEGKYVSGLSLTCGNFGVSFLASENQLGEDRYPASVCAMTHEVGHNLGAQHDDSDINLMNSNALPYADINLENGTCALDINPKAAKQMRRCR